MSYEAGGNIARIPYSGPSRSPILCNERPYICKDVPYMSLFGRSRVRDRILLEFFAKPGTSVHVREMARRAKASPPIVGAEVAELARRGVLQPHPVGRLLVSHVNHRS